jgi:hypothetical protein
MRPDQLAELLESGPAILGASVSEDGPPEAFRCWGTRLEADILRVYIGAEADLTMARVGPEARLAVTATDILTFRSVQMKGPALGPAEPLTRQDAETIRRYTAVFTAQLGQIGHPPALAERLRPVAPFAVSMRIEQLYDQTPGPGAGAHLRSDRP